MEKQNSDVMLTTFDNPFNPFTDFEIWWKNDLRLGYDCCGLLAKTANTSSILSDEINDKRVEEAMKKICNEQPLIYRMVTEKDYHG